MPLLRAALLMWVLLIITTGCQKLPRGCPPTCIGVNLRGRDLNGSDLKGANFSRAILERVQFHGTNLSEA
ncbi:MAG: pentapeptide repeat-containing protein, partial [Candidatus Tectomicrobia bacterium]|nr:pentapeptide repeat-containing protein [Candidatus Tectomicrobia bacterium]